MLDKAVAYAAERQQFGRVIGSFQAVKHMCAEMAARLEPSRALIWHAAHALDTGEPEGLAMATLGILIGLVGGDLFSGAPRFTFGTMNLYDGLNLLVIAMGIFGVAEVSANVGQTLQSKRPVFDTSLRAMIPTRDDLRRSWKAILRGSGIGSFFGVIPGTGPLIASFVAYSAELSAAKDKSRFGRGAIEGLTAPEAANNAAEQTSFIPTLALGIPGSAAMAIMLSVFLIHGITPGPGLLNDHADIVWGLIMSFWIGNVLLVALNIPMIGIWVRLLSVPYHYLFPCILIFICLGVYSIHNSAFDIWMVLVFSVVGFGMRLLDLPAAPMLLGFILGPMIEEHFRRSMLIARGDLTTFFQTPLSAGLISCVLLIFLWRGARMVRDWRVKSAAAGTSNLSAYLARKKQDRT